MYLQMAQCMHKTSVKDANVWLTGEVTGKNVIMDTKKVSKMMKAAHLTFKKPW